MSIKNTPFGREGGSTGFKIISTHWGVKGSDQA
jgi:hypothetical protein